MADKKSETVSKNKPRKRGRPRVIPDEHKYVVDFAMGPEAKTERTRQSLFYQLIAQQVLIDDPKYDWLFKDGGELKLKFGILRELGRIQDDDTMRVVAARVCELRPRTREAALMIRRFRIGREVKTSLLDHLTSAVDDYFMKCPSVPQKNVIQALRNLADLLELGGE